MWVWRERRSRAARGVPRPYRPAPSHAAQPLGLGWVWGGGALPEEGRHVLSERVAQEAPHVGQILEYSPVASGWSGEAQP